MPLSRNAALRRLGLRARKLTDVQPCYYCGMPATCYDHVIPVAILASLSDDAESYEKIVGNRITEVPACTECNSLLNASFQKNVTDRRIFLKERLRKRYRKLLAMPSFTESELNEYGPVMRQYIEQSIKNRNIVLERLKW